MANCSYLLQVSVSKTGKVVRRIFDTLCQVPSQEVLLCGPMLGRDGGKEGGRKEGKERKQLG